MNVFSKILITLSIPMMLLGCEEHDEFDSNKQVFGLADSCYRLKHDDTYLGAPFGGESRSFKGYVFNADANNAADIFITATDLGSYLLYGDKEKSYLTVGDEITEGRAKGGHYISYPKFLESETSKPNSPEDQMLLSPGEWMVEQGDNSNQVYLYNITSKQWLAIANDGKIALSPIKDHPDYHTEIVLENVAAQRCHNFPESEVNATGQITKKTWPNGDLWGIADIHEHIMPGFTGPDNLMHGTPFHKLGIEHALHDCEKHHGKGGARDLFKYPGINPGGENTEGPDVVQILADIANNVPLYDTSGYPDFKYWPAFDSITHQTTYYKWIERAYLGGTRIITEYIEGSKVSCDVLNLIVPMPYKSKSCDEMDMVDLGIERLKDMERYIDAKNGGAEKGWFRLVYSASEAREVVASGKLAVIIGLEIENPFNCNKTGWFSCSETYVQEQLDKYYDLGVRAIFPTHKFHNSFGAGDGTPGFLEIFEFLNDGMFRDYIACDDTNGAELALYESHQQNSILIVNGRPDESEEQQATRLNKLKQDYELITGTNSDQSTKSNFLGLILPIYDYSPSGHCQRKGMTDLGKEFVKMLMRKGMIIDSSHYGTNALAEAFELYEEYDYPPVMTHGKTYAGKLLDLGGIQTTSFIQNCVNQNTPEEDHAVFRDNYQSLIEHPTAYRALAFGHDFNGIAPLPKPRFGDNAQCHNPQDPDTKTLYPFTTYGGDFVMEKQVTGNRVFDINTDGLATIGLFPDLIEQERRKGLTEDMLQTMYRGAEGYVRAWEKMERQGKLVD